MGQKREMTLIADERGCAEQLARFFPQLSALRIPVRVSPLRPGASASKLQEATILEYGAQDCAIFQSGLPLEFGDRLRVMANGGGRSAEAAVIALQYHEGKKAVAVRFVNGPCEWIQQP